MVKFGLVVLMSVSLAACANSNRPAPRFQNSTPAWGAASPAASRYFAAQPGATGQPAGTVTPDGPTPGLPFPGSPFAGLEVPGLPLPGILSSGPGGSLPAALTFRFGVGDEIATSVWKEPELTASQKIMADGTISPPLLKTVRVVDLTVDEVQAVLTRAYTEYLKDPKVSVRVSGIQSDRAFVSGEVRSPQAVMLSGPTTVLQAITMAGGFVEETADKSEVHLMRRGSCGQAMMARVDVRHILDGTKLDQVLERGDMVFVPAKGITNWARFMSQLFSPLSTAVGTAGGAATIRQTTR